MDIFARFIKGFQFFDDTVSELPLSIEMRIKLGSFLWTTLDGAAMQ